jgi:hypothetical protein
MDLPVKVVFLVSGNFSEALVAKVANSKPYWHPISLPASWGLQAWTAIVNIARQTGRQGRSLAPAQPSFKMRN